MYVEELHHSLSPTVSSRRINRQGNDVILCPSTDVRVAQNLVLPFIKRRHLKYAQALHHQLAVIQGNVQLVLEDEGAGEVVVHLCRFWHLEEESEANTNMGDQRADRGAGGAASQVLQAKGKCFLHFPHLTLGPLHGAP